MPSRFDVSNTSTKTGKKSKYGSSRDKKPKASTSSFHAPEGKVQQKQKTEPTISGLAEQLTALGRRSKKAGI